MPTYVFPLPGWTGPIQLHHGSHRGGSDLMAPRGQSIVSLTAGTVTSAGREDVAGNYVNVKGDDGLVYFFAHMNDTPLVKDGDRVNPGSRLGAVGNTGNASATPPHLHLGIGKTILLGTGPAGGVGSDFDAVTFLQKIYAGQAPDTKADPTGKVGDTIGDKAGDIINGPKDFISDSLGKAMYAFFRALSAIVRGA